MNGARLSRLLGRLIYGCSAVPFIAFVARAFPPDSIGREPARMLIVNALIFAAAGVTAVLVKNMAFNAVMAAGAYPYGAFLFERWGTDPSRWSTNDVEGSVIYVTLYTMLGMASSVAWVLYALYPKLRWLGGVVLSWCGDRSVEN